MIYIGHSRGCENALQTAVERDAHGLILVNPTGLRIHRGIRPMYRLEAVNSLYNVLPVSMANSMMLASELKVLNCVETNIFQFTRRLDSRFRLERKLSTL